MGSDYGKRFLTHTGVRRVTTKTSTEFENRIAVRQSVTRAEQNEGNSPGINSHLLGFHALEVSSPMAFRMLASEQQAKKRCPRCQQDIRDDQPKLFLGEQPFHYDCWMRAIIGPREYQAHEITRQRKADAAISATEKKHVD